jgi:SAM-dependent methyltransferase
VCDSTELSVFVEIENVPTQDGVLWESAAEAQASPLGDIRLALCQRCSYVWNVAHDPANVTFTRYDVSLQHSPSFRTFVLDLCRDLVERHNLRGRSILEIGSGGGDFLEALCAVGGNRGVGFDPSYLAQREAGGGAAWHIVPEPYSERVMRTDVDFVACRHVLDIVDDQRGLLDLARRTLAGRAGGIAYFEVPDARHTLEGRIFWNLVYEHRTWFVPDSLRTLFARAGLEVIAVERLWHDEYLGIEARPRTSDGNAPLVPPDENGLAATVTAFATELSAARDAWSERMRALADDGRRVALWGAGARAIGFLSLVPAAAAVCAYAVDINPKRQGLFLPRTAIRVEAPDHVRTNPVDLVLITNPTYAEEIAEQARALGVRCPIDVL